VIRALFIITLFAGGGTSLLIYLALAIALDKEPPEMMDDFEF
jgi:phage shock protein C